jgi:transposase InsO family protein
MDLLDREIEPVVVPFGVAAELAAAVSQHAQELDADIAELFDELQQSNFCTNDLLFCRHSHTKTKSPQTNGICERFHQTAFNEFYLAFRKNVYRSPTSWRRIWLVDQSPMPHSGASRARGLTATAPPK